MLCVCNIKNIKVKSRPRPAKGIATVALKGCACPRNMAATTPPEALKVPTRARRIAAHHTSRGYPREGIEDS